MLSWLKKLGASVRRYAISLPAFVLFGLVAGSLISIWLIPQPKVAILSLPSITIRQATVDDILDKLKQLREDNSIKAVVLEIDSPGGAVGATEQIYLDILHLKQKKPVVASLKTIAASGGYYIAVAADYIYAQRASQVGNIGVWVRLPEPQELDEDTVTTGPFKATGGSRRKVLAWLAQMKGQFVEVVMSHRGERLRLSREELSHGELYLGVEGLKYGLIDAIGTRADAIKKAAELARLRNYTVFSLPPAGLSFSLFFGSSELKALMSQKHLTPVYYYLYFEPE